jgi:hypothetical protein
MLRSNLEPFAVILLLCFLIGVALLAGPFYALWLRGGRRADRRGQRRRNHRGLYEIWPLQLAASFIPKPSYSKATPSGSFSANQASAASWLANTLREMPRSLTGTNTG